jgi:hypothetical protein
MGLLDAYSWLGKQSDMLVSLLIQKAMVGLLKRFSFDLESNV